MTQNKKRILDVFTQHHVVSMSELREQLPDIDASTLYRNVQKFLEDGILREVNLSGHETGFERSQEDNKHDHFICTSCHTAQEMNVSSVISKYLPKGSTSFEGEVVVKGLCKDCK